MEVWKDIDGYEGFYQVSNLGRVKRLRYKSLFREKILKPYKSKWGYYFLTLHVYKPKKYLVHRLVASAFIPNLENKPCVNHINSIKIDNRVENLEWVTYSENTQHALVNGLISPRKGANSHMYGKRLSLHHQAKKVIDTKTGVIYGSAKEAAIAFNINYGTLANKLIGNDRNNTTLKYL